MSKILKFSVLFSAFLAGAVAQGPAIWGEPAKFEITIVVVDDQGARVPDANVDFGWGMLSALPPNSGFVKKTSDQAGQASFSGITPHNFYTLRAAKAGFYSIEFWNLPLFKAKEKGEWIPIQDPYALVLKKVRNPIPMYAKKVMNLPRDAGEHFAYDLEKGDWLPPYGNGEVKDLVFSANIPKHVVPTFESWVRVTFSNPGDGLQRFVPEDDPQGSKFRSPYEAPADGYVSEWKLERSRREGREVKDDFKPKLGYFIRVRTVLDSNGKVKSALYGKIYGDFFQFVHYLNPLGDRNIEFDPAHNLIPAGSDLGLFTNNLSP